MKEAFVAEGKISPLHTSNQTKPNRPANHPPPLPQT